MLTEKQIKRLSEIPDLYKKMFEKVYENPKMKSLAIKTKCLDCTCYIRKEITLCASECCPLFLVRPYQENENEENDEALE